MGLCWSQWIIHILLKKQACEILLLLLAPFGLLLFHVLFFYKSFLQTLDYPISLCDLEHFVKQVEWVLHVALQMVVASF